MTKTQRRFVHALAIYLAKDVTQKSIALECGERAGKEWAALRQTTPIVGYPTIAEAEKILADFLYGASV